jgi:hypothetical protein
MIVMWRRRRPQPRGISTYPSTAERPMPVVIGVPLDRAARMMGMAEVAYTTRGDGAFVVASEPEPGEETARRREPAVLVLGDLPPQS